MTTKQEIIIFALAFVAFVTLINIPGPLGNLAVIPIVVLVAIPLKNAAIVVAELFFTIFAALILNPILLVAGSPRTHVGL